MEEKRRESSGTPPPPTPPDAAMEAPTSEQPTVRRRGKGQKRKLASLNSGDGSSNFSTSSKRHAREKPPVVPFPPIYTNGPCTRARVQPNGNNSFSLSEVIVKSEAEAREAAARAEEMIRATENWEALEAKITAEYEAIRSRNASTHVVPIHAGWFSWTKIHPLEKRMLPSFFSGKTDKRTPETFMAIRNWIVKKFHHDPNVQIELKHLSELTDGELDARQEVMEFLDYWGLINYHPLLDNQPGSMEIDADETGKTDSLIENLFKFETVESWNPVVPRMNTSIPALSSGLFPESVVGDEMVKSEGPSVEYHCNSCSGDCSRKRYHCQKQADFDLCTECFNSGNFDSNMSPSDFILMEPAESGGVTGGNWTDQETLLLLEAIEIFTDNWSEIAEHVATKTKAQCILHFLQMPIEDTFLNCDSENIQAPKENGLPMNNEDASLKAEQASDPALNDIITEKKESQDDCSDKQVPSCPMGISKSDDVSDSDKSCEVENSIAMKALMEAFEAVGSVPAPGEILSFAEAANPVMTLAAFLARLVEPNTAMASVHSLLKFISSNQSGEQLAARHCFQLEKPPDDKKKLADSNGAAVEAINFEALKHENAHLPTSNGETTDSIVDEINLRDDENDESKKSNPEEQDKKDYADEDQKPVASPNGECGDKSDIIIKDPNVTTTNPNCQPSESTLSEAAKGQGAEGSTVLVSKSEVEANSVKGSENEALADEPPEVEEKTLNSKNNDSELVEISNSVTEKQELKGEAKAKECNSEEKESTEGKDDIDVIKLKRAAVTALSAAAVKAKLLADHEEDQIRQLAAALIEKQLYKLESKLAFFNDMENVVMRVKEQLDRSKQRLFHERAQIIASRFGMSSSVRPPNSQLLPPNRAAAGNLINTAVRPFTGMNSLRPPVPRMGIVPNLSSSTSMPSNSK